MRTLLAILSLLWASAAYAATATPVAIVVSSCGAAGIYGPPGNSAPLTVDTAGNLCSSGGGGGGGGTSSNFNATFPAAGTAAGFKNGTSGDMVPGVIDNSTGGLNVNIVGGGGSGGTSSNFGSAFPTAGTAVGASDGTNMRALLVDASGFLKVILQTGANVVGAVTQSGTWNIGTVTTVTAVTSVTNAVTVAQATASNLLAQVSNNGTFAVQAAQSGAPWSMTGSGSAGSPAAGVLTVQGITSMTALKVDGTGGTFPISGTVTANQGGAPWTMTGTGSAGSAASGVLTVQGITSMTPLLVNPGTAANWAVGATAGAVPANAQYIGGNKSGNLTGLVMGSSNDLTVGGAGTAGSAAGGVLTVQGVASMTPVQVSQATAANLNATVVQGTASNLKAQVTGAGSAGSADTGVVTVQGIASMTPLFGIVRDAAGNARGANVNASNQLSVSLDGGTGATVSLTSGSTIQPVGGASGGLTWYFVQPTAGDNHVNIKNGAGTVYHIAATNNSATINYIRLYNAATGFNGCNSATNLVGQWAVPASTSGAGFVADIGMGINFSTGISICVTSGYATTDTTNATASAMSVNVGYK